MPLSQQEIDDLKAEDAQLAALQSGATESTYPSSNVPGKIATFRFPGDVPAGPAPSDTGLLQQIQVGDNVARELGAPPVQGGVPAVPAPPAGLNAEQIAALKAEDAQLAAQEAAIPKAEPESRLSKLWSGVKERIDPKIEEKDGGVINPDLEKYPDWTLLAQPIDHPINTARAAFGTVLSTIDETADVIKEQFPDAKVEKAGKFGQYLKITRDGEVYTYKPGIRKSDFARAALGIPLAAGTVAAANLALGLAAPGTVLSGLGSALTGAAGLETAKYSAGGGFNPDNLAGAAAVHVGGDLLGKGVKAVGGAVRSLLPEAAPAAVPQMTAQQIANEMVPAAQGKSGALARVAGQVQPNAEVVAAAERLGVTDALDPSHVSTNPGYRQAAQAIPEAAARNSSALTDLGQNLKQAVIDAGGHPKPGTIDSIAAEAIADRLQQAKNVQREAYKEVFGGKNAAGQVVEGLVPRSTEAEAGYFLTELDRIKAQQGGTLPKDVQRVVKALFPNGEGTATTVDLMDRTRKLLRAATRGKGPFGKALQSTGEAQALFDAIDKDQFLAADARGAGEKFRAAQEAFSTYADMQALTDKVLGKELEKSLAGRLAADVSSAPYVRPNRLDKVLEVIPQELRPELLKSSVLQFLDENGKMDAKTFTTWWNELKANKPSWSAFRKYAGDEFVLRLEDTAKVAGAINEAMAKTPGGAVKFPNGTSFVKKLVYLGAANLAKAGVEYATGVHIPGEINGFFLAILFRGGGTEAVNEALKTFITSPAGREAMRASAKGAVSEGFIRSIASSGTFRALMDAAKIQSGARVQWLKDAFSTQQQEGSK